MKNKRFIDGNNMNNTEKQMNNKKTVRVNFEHHTEDMICGIPGFSRPYDRVK